MAGRSVYSGLVVGTVAALVAGLCAAVPAAAVTPTKAPAAAAAPVPAAAPAAEPATQVAAGRVGPPPPEESTADAQRSAKASGQRVEVASRRTERDTTYANPNGSLTTDFGLSPVRVRRDGGWEPVDLGLEPSGGRLAPKASPVGLSVSASGAGPVVELAEGARRLGISWPQTLPAARVAGRVAEYPLGDGAVLQATSTVDGVRLRVVLSQRPAQAPVWRLPLALDGLTAAQLSDGSFRFTDAAGEAVFGIPALRMWDATRTEDGMPKRETPVEARLVSEGGQLMLEVAPSAAWLTDEATVYPVTVDPDVTTELAQVRDTWVQQGVTGGRGGDPKLFTGLVDGNIARSFVAYDSSPLNNAKITKAELKLYTSFTGSCTPSPVFVRPVTEAWENATTVWTNQPAFSSNDAYLGKKSFAYGNSAEGCPADRWASIDVTPIVVERTDSDGVMEVDHGMRIASLEGGETKRHTFCSNNPGAGSADAPCTTNSRRPVLSVTYNKTPNVPTAQATTPTKPCATGAAAPSMPTSGPTLKANVSDPDGGLVYGEFQVALASNLSSIAASGTSAAVTSGGVGSWKVSKGKLADGVKYAWRVRAYDLQRRSVYTDWCEFTVTLPPPALNPPTTIHASGAELSWPAYSNPDEPFTEYQIHRGTTAGFTPSDSTRVSSLPTGASSFTDTTAPPTPADAGSETGSTVYYKLVVKTEGGTLVGSPAQQVALPKAGRTTKILQAGGLVTDTPDTTLSASQPATNLDSLGGQAAVEVGNNSPTYGETRALVRFDDLSDLPAGSRVMAAQLGLWATANTGSGAGFNAHALTRDFAETQATWAQAATLAPWASPGGDFDVLPANPTPAGVTGAGAWVSIDVGAAVSGWVAAPSSNHGLVVKTAGSTPGQRATFASSEATAAQRPRLAVTYLTKSTASTYYAPHTPQLMVPNEDEQVSVTVTNTTATTWAAADWVLSYRWLKPDGTLHSVPAEGASLANPGTPAQDMSPGEQLDITRTVKPPINAANAGRSEWVLAWDMRNLTTNQWLSDLEQIPPLEQTVAVEDPGEIKGGLEDFYQYAGQPTGAGSSVLVNQHSGNSVFSYDVFSHPSRGLNTFLRLAYNSRDKTNAAAGHGWSVAASTVTKLGSPLAFGPTASGQPTPGSVYLTDGDGSLHEFTLNAQNEYVHPPGVHLYLQKLTPGAGDQREWVMTAPDRTKFYFDADGYHIATTDRNENTLSFSYDPLPQNPGDPKTRYLTSVTDQEARTTLRVSYYLKGDAYTYIDDAGARQTDANLTDPDIYGNIKSITDISGGPDGAGVADRTVNFYYSNTGLLRELVDGEDDAAKKKVFKFGYDPTQVNTNTKLVSVTDPRANTTNLAYYSPPPGQVAPNHWKVESITDRAAPTPGVTRFVYVDPDGQAGGEVNSTVTDAEGRATTYTMDAFGRPVEIIDPKSQDTHLTWDTDHNVVLLEEPAAQTGGTTAKTQWAYDPQTGFPLVMIDAVANGATADPNPLTTTKPHTRFTYQTSLAGNVAELATKKSPLGFIWQFDYDSFGNLTTVTDPEGVASAQAGDFQTAYTYHPRDAANNDTRPNGLLETVTDANGHTTRYEAYDANGYPERSTDAAGFDTLVDYDARGNVVSVTDAKNNTSTYTYDLFSRPLESRVPKSDTETIITPAPAYDANDNTLKAFAPYINTAPNPLTEWSYVYDKLDRLDTATQPKDKAGDPARLTDYSYDKVGNLTKTVEPNAPTTPAGNDFTTSNGYDTVDQLTSQVDGDGDRTEYDYDRAGNLVTVRNPKKVASADQADFTAKFTYDLGHRQLTALDADGGNPHQTGYDADGRVTSVTDESSAQTTYGYDRRGLLTRVTAPHDPTGPDFDTATTEYRYDQVGNRTHEISPRGAATTGVANDFVTRFVYDELNRVDKRFLPCNPPAPCNPDGDGDEWPDYVDFDYDEVGNLAAVSRPPSAGAPDVRADTSYSYTDNGWVKTTTDPWEITTAYDQDAMGNQTRRTVTPAGEDPAGSTASRVQTWAYTPDGKMAARTDEGVPVSRRVAVVDNSDTQHTTKAGTPAWEDSTDATKTYHGHNYLTHDPGAGVSFTWDLAVPKAGSYQVFIRHGAEATATTASYTVHHQSGASAPITRSQATGAGTWKSLGTFSFAKGTSGQKVVLSGNGAGGVVAADAVKLVRTSVETDTERKTYTYSYDPNGNLAEINDGSSGAAVNFYKATHTGANQVDTVVERAGGPTGTVKKTTDFGYDPNGAVATLLHDPAAGPDQHSTYTYGDARDLLTQVRVGATASDPNAKTTSFTWGPRRLRQTQTKHNGNTVAYDYYADRMLKDMHERRSGGADVARHQLTYTLNGHRDTDTTRVQNADTGGYLDFVRDYDYDPRDRVTQVQKKSLAGAVQETETYAYDGAGNITRQVIADAATTTTDFVYDRDRLLASTATSGGASTTADYNYDPFGRLDTVIAGAGSTAPAAGTVLESYDYDGFDRIERHTKRTDAGSTVTTAYAYDPLDRTTSRTREPGTAQATNRYFTYLGLTETLISEATDAAGANPAKTYAYTPGGERLSQTKHLAGGGTEDSYYGYNPHTDVETITKPDGTTRATYGYTAYGANDKEAFTGVDKPDAGDPLAEPYNAYRYTGKRWDEATESLDMGFRDYSPGLNRFLTLDSYNGALADMNLGANPWTSNRYTLAGGNPITGVELDGHEPRPWHDPNFDSDSFNYDAYWRGEQRALNTSSAGGGSGGGDGGGGGGGSAGGGSVAHDGGGWLDAVGDWVSDHKAEIAGVATGVVVYAGCTTGSAGAGVVACGVAAGAAGSAVTNALDPNADHSITGYTRAIGTGALFGGIAGPAAKAVGSVLSKAASSIGSGASRLSSRVGGGGATSTQGATKGETELVQRWMSRAELDATIDSGLVRGGRAGPHYVTDFANHNALRARQRLALPQTGEVRVQLEVPRGAFSPPKPVDPDYYMPGGGMERTATGLVPCRVVCVWD